MLTAEERKVKIKSQLYWELPDGPVVRLLGFHYWGPGLGEAHKLCVAKGKKSYLYWLLFTIIFVILFLKGKSTSRKN